MSNDNQEQQKSEILLETGTNEFEIVEFSIGDTTYGINVAKVREVINRLPITKMPNTHPYVDGVFTLRGGVIPLINLATCLGISDAKLQRVIIGELNNYKAGFLVDDVARIHRISWTKMEPAPHIANSDLVVGIVKLEDKMIILLDFEKIISETNPEINKTFHNVRPAEYDEILVRNKKKIYVAEDSPMLRNLLVDTLSTAGYNNVHEYENGLEAWNAIIKIKEEKKTIFDDIDLLITDIEMPQMDGHHLIKKIKEDENMRELPIIIFSSLINEENRRKGTTIGANAQVSKPEIDKLIDLIDELVR